MSKVRVYTLHKHGAVVLALPYRPGRRCRKCPTWWQRCRLDWVKSE